MTDEDTTAPPRRDDLSDGVPWLIFWISLVGFTVLMVPFGGLMAMGIGFHPCGVSDHFVCTELGRSLMWLPHAAQAVGVVIALVAACGYRGRSYAPGWALLTYSGIYVVGLVTTSVITP